MNILLLGGTGAMGTQLQEILKNSSHSLTVTSRSPHTSNCQSVRYVQGNAKDLVFLKRLLTEKFDAVIDFMFYSTAEFQERYRLFLDSTPQYIFISSARVYAQSDVPITEQTPRLLDVCTDQIYLVTDEYALAKARSEDLLRATEKKNFTIIRPSITYSTYRLQLGVLEKENWLYRAMNGRSIVFSEDIASKYTAMTTGMDVSRGIAAIIGQESALGKTFHITCERSYLWREILQCYLEVLNRHGIHPKVIMTDKSLNLHLKDKVYQVIYCRYFNRTFDNSKISHYLDVSTFVQPMDGLAECLEQFLQKPVFGQIDWRLEGLHDRFAHEKTPLKEIPSLKQRITYCCYRHHLEIFLNFLKGIKKWIKRG